MVRSLYFAFLGGCAGVIICVGRPLDFIAVTVTIVVIASIYEMR